MQISGSMMQGFPGEFRLLVVLRDLGWNRFRVSWDQPTGTQDLSLRF